MNETTHRGASVPIQRFGLGLAAAFAFLLPAGAVAQTAEKQPTLNLFPTQVVDTIKETGDSAKKLEDDLQNVMADLDRQMELYRRSKCEGAIEDSGCRQLSRQMASTYRKMLETMAQELPKIRRSITLTRDALERRLAAELGRNRTGAELQRLLRNEGREETASLRTRVRHDGVRLSDRFRQYYRLVNQGASGSLALIGAELYLDLEETSRLTALTEEQIQRGVLLANLSESFGTITPRMGGTVSDVKRVLFGEGEVGGEAQTVPADVRSTERSGFCSEFDPDC